MENSDFDQFYPLMREYTRIKIWEIWQTGKLGQALNEEDARLYEVLEHHMQHARLWDRLADASDTEIVQNGVNLVLHVLFHHAIGNQLAADTPSAVRQVLRALMKVGLKEHDAVHAIASVLAWEVHDMMQTHRVFDETRYVRALRQLPLQAKQNMPRKKRG